jgi:hypothetical protein
VPRKPNRQFRSQAEGPLPPVIAVDFEGWMLRKKRRECRLRAESLGTDAVVAVLYSGSLQDPTEYEVNLKAAVADAIEAARAGFEYLALGGSVRHLMPLERRSARERLLKRSTESIKARNPRARAGQ